MQIFTFDHLSPTDFENFCYDLLEELGFVNINWRKGTGLSTSPSDGGRDIECELHRIDIGGERVIEKWFVECKHYKEGVPPDKISGARAWAEAERPDNLLIIASNFLSNATKANIEAYKRTTHPSFKIKVWERPRLEYLTKSKSQLLRKYKISGEFPFLSLLHPVHIKCLKDMPISSLDYFFTCIDQLDVQKRDEIFGYVYYVILRPRYREAITGKETMKSLQIDEVSYDLFKKKCYQIAGMGGLDQWSLVYFMVSFVLQHVFAIADSTTLDEAIERHKVMIAYAQKQIEAGQGDEEEHRSSLKFSQELIEKLPDQIERNYQLYRYFCENFLEKLFEEQRLYLQKFKHRGEGESELYDFVLQWYRAKGQQEQEQKPRQPNPPKTRRKRKTNS